MHSTGFGTVGQSYISGESLDHPVAEATGWLSAWLGSHAEVDVVEIECGGDGDTGHIRRNP